MLANIDYKISSFILVDLIFIDSEYYSIILYCPYEKEYLALYFIIELSELVPKRVEKLMCNLGEVIYNYDRGS